MSGSGLFHGKFPFRVDIRADNSFLDGPLQQLADLLEGLEPGSHRLTRSLDWFFDILERRREGESIRLLGRTSLSVYVGDEATATVIGMALSEHFLGMREAA